MRRVGRTVLPFLAALGMGIVVYAAFTLLIRVLPQWMGMFFVYSLVLLQIFKGV